MSHGKPERYEMWMGGKAPSKPEISKLLPKLILELALVEAVIGPWASEVLGSEYIAQFGAALARTRGPGSTEAAIPVSEGLGSGRLPQITGLGTKLAIPERGTGSAIATTSL